MSGHRYARFGKFKKKNPCSENQQISFQNKDDTQTTISKFFSTNAKRKAINDADDADSMKNDVNRDSRNNKKEVTVPLTKRPKTEENVSTPYTKTQELSKLAARAKHKLQNFVATDLDSLQTQDVNSFDYSVLKRENASKLSDIYSQDEMETVSNVIEDSQDKYIAQVSTNTTPIPHMSTHIPHMSTPIPHMSTDISHTSTHILHTSTSFEKHTINIQNPQTAISKLCKFSANKPSKQIETGKKTVRAKSANGLLVKYTPLEQQFIELKDKWKDAVLFVECGYKYRFFGEDAEIASRVLKIYAHQDHNFMTASIPVHRLFIHLRRIVSAGYKVGVIQQMETSALKAAGSNKNTPFTRQLTALYTKATMIGEDMDTEPGEAGDGVAPVAMTTSYLMCICEQEAPKGSPGTLIGITAVQPSTGDIIYDSFVDTGSRPELETRLSHIQPVEVIMPSNVSMETEKLLTGLQTISYHGDDRMRLERLDPSVFEFSEAFSRVSHLFQHEATSNESSGLQTVINLPQPVICCLGALVQYLQDFNLDKILREVGNFSQFSTKTTYMQLNSCTVRNLEIFHNLTNRGERGSLYWVINHTVTPAGARLLRMWLSRPLLSHSYITLRQEAVSNILDGKFPDIQKLKVALSRLPDVERRLASVYHKKCCPSDFYGMCQALITIHDKFQHQNEAAASCRVTSKLLLEIISEIPELLSDVGEIVDKIDGTAAKENDKTKMFSDDAGFLRVLDCKEKITLVTEEIHVHRRYVRLTIRQPTLQYCTILGTEFLVEVKNSGISLVPNDWTKINSTKVMSRFHTPFIVAKYKELQQYREQLVIESNKAWMQFLDSFCKRYQHYRKAIHHMSTMDCLLSLATVAQQHAYIRPEMVEDEVCIDIEGGRHPVIEELLGENKQYVANDTRISTTGKHVMMINGPNMGGKSCYIRQVALVSVLAQIGSFVPACAARLGILDSIFTRMGGADDIYGGRSTFMVELQQAADIMAKVTSRSLVILDELGRGTSTHDGVAIAHATLDFFIRQKCLTLFVTHYQSLTEFETVYPGAVGNYHMSFLLGDDDTDSDGLEQITFLYELVPGVAARSYGLNVARLATIPEHIVKMASIKSQEMESNELSHRSRCELFQKLCATSGAKSYKQLIEQLS